MTVQRLCFECVGCVTNGEVEPDVSITLKYFIWAGLRWSQLDTYLCTYIGACSTGTTVHVYTQYRYHNTHIHTVQVPQYTCTHSTDTTIHMYTQYRYHSTHVHTVQAPHHI